MMCAGRLNSKTCGYTHGDAHIEYRKHVSMDPDLMMAPGFVSHIENYEPRLGGFCRVVRFDKRGTGLSDHRGEAVPTLPLKAERPHATSRPILSKTTEVINLLLLSAPGSFSWV